MVTPLTSDFVSFVGNPRECRGDVAFPPSFGPQPSGAIEETGTIFESTLCCVAPRVGVRDSQSTLCCVAPRVGVRDQFHWRIWSADLWNPK